MSIRTQAVDSVSMVFDDELIPSPEAGLFDPGHWRERGLLAGQASGRGAVWFVRAGAGHWALRHYRRGGLVGRLIEDAYLYTGRDRVRSWAEFQVLSALREAGLPVPRPVAAAWRRSGPWYRADLITVLIEGARTLTQRLAANDLGRRDWRAVGECIRRFHDHGLNHADLNAHNILFDPSGSVWLIDFDRARIQPEGQWRAENLQRLLRSLNKVCRDDQALAVTEGWSTMRAAYGDIG